MKAPKAFWIGIICAIGGCTQLLELDQEYRPSQTSAGGSAGASTGGMAGAGGNSVCGVDGDCVPTGNPCAENKCIDGACVASNLPAGSSCVPDGTVVCDANGICGECNQPSDCMMLPPDDECQTRTCDNHVCAQTFAPAGTLLMNQVMGDCVDAFCDGAGKTTKQPNNADLPEDNNACTKNQCNAGMPSFPYEPIDTSCGVAQKCNDMGQCVGCFGANDCPGVDDFCKVRTCTNGVCGFNFSAMGTDLPSGQTPGDCRVLECDGQGNVGSVPDNVDVPTDGNACTKDVCTAGVPSNPFEAANTPCGGGGTCNAAGICRTPNGTACMSDTTCASGYCVEGYCCDSACGQICKACNVPGSLGICTVVPPGYSDDACLSPKSCDGTQGGNACTTKYPMGYPCTLGTQCGSGMCVDGVCCSSSCTAACKSCNVAGSAGTCSNLPLGQVDGTSCSGANACDGMGLCKKVNGQGCTGATECMSGICVDGVCCSSTCTDTCKSCNVPGFVGTCTNVLAGTDDTPTCAGTSSCNGNGICKKDDGQGCAAAADCLSNFCVDGVCCNTSCTQTCRACNVTGSLGTCTNVPVNADDAPTCMGTNSCDGNGACKKDSGAVCAMNSECVSGFCVDGVCCNTSCLGTCQACNVAGTVGTCVNVPLGQEDPIATTACTGINSCNGAGACLLDNGQPCTLSTQCVSGNCTAMMCQ